MFCKKCGKEIDNDSLFCQYCGTNIDVPDSSDRIESAVKSETEVPNADIQYFIKSQQQKKHYFKDILFSICALICVGVLVAIISVVSSDSNLLPNWNYIKFKAAATVKGYVDITLPEEFSESFEKESSDKTGSIFTKDLKENGIKEIIKNENGTVTVKIYTPVYNEYVKDLKKNIEKSFKEIIKEDNSVKDIKYNRYFTDVKCYVDESRYKKSLDSINIVAVKLEAVIYNAFTGNNYDDVSVSVYDYKTEKQIKTD